MNDDDDDLGENDSEEALAWPPPERKVVTQSYDLSINTLLEQWDDETLVIPEFQREYVWDDRRASRLIESLLLNIPIPVLYFAETEDARYEVVDGHQRVRSVIRFLKNEYPLRGLRIQDEFKGLRYHQLPLREQRFLRSRTMRAVIIAFESHANMKFEIFERLNTGAVALNAQEIRNAIYRGPLNDLLRDLQHNASFRTCIGRRSPRPRQVDQELVLRYLALSEGRLRHYRPPLLRFLNDYMRTRASATRQIMAEQVARFEQAAFACELVFGPDAYRTLSIDGRVAERTVNRALFEAQMLVLGAVSLTAVSDNRKMIRSVLGQLCAEDEYADAIGRATGDRLKTHFRILAFADRLANEELPVAYDVIGLPRAS